ncbi:hypothetical protein [Spirosoma litoris]
MALQVAGFNAHRFAVVSDNQFFIITLCLIDYFLNGSSDTS